MRITIVDDILENLELYNDLLSPTFEIKLIQKPMELIAHLETNSTDLVLLDIHMPDINGFELYERLKNKHPELPVIFLSSDPSEDALVKGLNLGADDFILKPVSLKELVARIKNRINHKRRSGAEQQEISIDCFTLHCDMQMAEVEGQKVQLTPIEYKLIHLLAKSPNKIFSREFISKLLWPDVHVQNQNIDTHLSNLRKKLHPFSKNIKTIKSRGYILRV